MRNAEHIATRFAKIHQQICAGFEKSDGHGKFVHHPWEKTLGSGLTCVMRDGAFIEKAGINFSNVSGTVTPQMEKIIGEKAGSYAATGISSIIHPTNPFLPIIHMNVRYFELDNGTSWFGGGMDLTPHYIDTGEAKKFHTRLATICDKYDKTYYPRFKVWADDYFYLTHRHETRGVGGIFFDRLQPENESSLEQLTAFASDLALGYPDIYGNIINDKPKSVIGPGEKLWQKLRRGRYVEFNLLYDRGTRFGLESGGNIESILISLPPEANWEYDFNPESGTPEWNTLQLLKKGVDWLNF